MIVLFNSSYVPAGDLTLMAVDSLLSSRTTVARASGFTPASSSCTHTRSVSSSRPVFRRSEISFTAAYRENENILVAASDCIAISIVIVWHTQSKLQVCPPHHSLRGLNLNLHYSLFMASLASESRSAEVAAGVLDAIF